MPEHESVSVREMILNNATRLFVERGYNGVSMREIAEACKLSKAGLYYHFTDKEALFLAILNGNLDAITNLVHKTNLRTQNTRERIIGFSHAIFTELTIDQRSMIRLANQELRNLQPALQEQFLKKYHEEFIDAVASMLSEGMQAGELQSIPPQTAAWALLGLLYPFLDFPFDVHSHHQLFDDVLNIFFYGVTKQALDEK
jgi:AcrR family transcriptional regulator